MTKEYGGNREDEVMARQAKPKPGECNSTFTEE
jgi:hypothetical protein